MIAQARIDLLRLLGGDLRRVAATGGGEYAGACPFCGGRDRFRVWPHADPPRWWCRQCARHGDAVDLVMQRESVGFREAVRRLGLPGIDLAAPAPVHPPDPTTPPPEAWQQAARVLVERSQRDLAGPSRKPLAWLQGRGFTAATLTAAQIGYQAQDQWVPRAGWGLASDGPRTQVWLPRGIVIPWFADGHLWRVFIRRPIPPAAWEAVWRPAPDTPQPRGVAAQVLQCLWSQRSFLTEAALARQGDRALAEVQAALTELEAARLVQRPLKHYQVPGGSNAIYNADAIRPDRPLVLVEAALDALAIQQEAGDRCAAVATGTTGGRSMHWISRIAQAPLVLLAFDADPGGDAPTAYWQDVLQERALRWRPARDDPAAMLEQGQDVRAWVLAGLRAAAPDAHTDGAGSTVASSVAPPTRDPASADRAPAAPSDDPVLAACAAVGVPEELLDDRYFLPGLRQAVVALAQRGAREAQRIARRHVRGSQRKTAQAVLTWLVAHPPSVLERHDPDDTRH